MGILGDGARLIGEAWKAPRPGFAESIKQSADAAEAANRMRAGGGVDGLNGVSANPFENLAAMNSMARGSGTVVSVAPTGEELGGAAVYLVVFDVVADGMDAPVRREHRQVISAAALGNFQVGSVMPVRFSPDDPSAFMIG